MSVVGDNIRALRTLFGEGRDITQSDLAEIAGVTRETVNKWESGAIGNVRTANINRLREHFGLSVDDLRSESAGLAVQLRAKQGAAAREAPDGAVGANRAPLLALDDSISGHSRGQQNTSVEIPMSVAVNHRHAFVVVVPDASMANVLPKGCHALVDPDIRGGFGAIVIVRVPGVDVPLVRRMHRGATKVMLSSEGMEEGEDLVLDVTDVQVLGTIVWYQAASELSG